MDMPFMAWFKTQYTSKTRKKHFTAREKAMLRPIAEVFAILDGNAFWGLSVDEMGQDNWFEQYLPEAWIVYKNNPSVVKGTSWYQDHIEHENDTVTDAYTTWQLMKLLAGRR